MSHTADVIIIGGGVVGCAAAYYLTQKGVKNVIVLEASDSIGHGGSSRNGGGVRQSGRDVRELPYAMYAIQHMWPTLSEELGVDVEYYQKGNLRLGKTEAHMQKLQKLASNAQAVGLNVRMVDGKEVTAEADFYVNGHKKICRFVQIELESAARDAEAIANIPYLDGCILGMHDLSGSIGRLGDIFCEENLALANMAIKAFKDAGKTVGVATFATDEATLKRYHEMGINMICTGADYVYVTDGAKKTMETLKSVRGEK